MKLSSFLLGILLIVGAYEVRQASSSAAAAAQVLQTLQLSNCDDLKVRVACFQRKYRTFDGTCNNLCNISLGAANRPLQRLIDPDYEANLQPRRLGNDGITLLPNPRRVSRVVFRSGNFNLNMTAPNFTHMTMTWGQFIDHDITLTELTQGVECGTSNEPCVVRDGCIGIPLTERPADRLQFNQSAQCIPLSRSLISSDGQQLNLLTSFIDGSQVYGSDIELANRLRDSKSNLGLLHVEPFINSMGQPVLPDADEEAFCRSTDSTERPCFLAGDVRVNENQALMAMHVIWVREHNRIALKLHTLNKHWSNEKLFQEARKIVGAEIQHITYNEWLPVLFNDALRKGSGLLLEPKGSFFTGYDPSVNPEMMNSFSTAALRMGHSLIRSNFTLLDRQFRRQGFGEPDQIPTRDYFNPDRFYRPKSESANVYGGILLGLMRTFSHQIDPIMSPAVRERLIIEGPTRDGIPGDLSAINMQRGRDHGLPGYTEFREACGGAPAHYFSDIADTVTEQQIQRLQNVYDNVKDIDLWAGAMSEFPAPGSALGLTFTHILIKQFRALRVGDRFWYERDDHQTGFTLAQLDQIREASLARIICDNADGIDRVHPRVFVHRNAANPDGSNDAVHCDDVPFVDLNVFKEGSGMEPSDAGGEADAFVGA